MKIRFILPLMALILIAVAPVAAQTDDGAPDSFYVAFDLTNMGGPAFSRQITFAEPPWPDTIFVNIYIWSDELLAGTQLGFRPEDEAGDPFVDIFPVAEDKSQSVWTSAIPIPMAVDTSQAAALVGSVAFPPYVDSPQGLLTTIKFEVKNPSIPAGTKITIDSAFVPPAGVFLYTEVEGGLSQEIQPAPFRPATGPNIILDVEDLTTPSLPTSYVLEQNKPNPFNPETSIDFAIPRSGHVSIEIFNTLGQKVKTLVDEPLTAGVKRVRWDGHDDRGKEVASGVYFYRMTVNDFTQSKKMLLLK